MTASGYNAAVVLVDRHVEAGAGDRVALVIGAEPTSPRTGPEQWSYSDLQAEIWRAQQALAELEIRPGDRVVMVVNDEPAFHAWFLGGLRSGVVPVPLSTMLTPGELGAIAADADASALVVSAEYAPHVTAIVEQAPTIRHAVVLDAFDAATTSPVDALSGDGRVGGGPCLVGVRRPERGAGRPDDRGLARVLVVQLGNDGNTQGCDPSPLGPRGDGENLRPHGARHRPRRPLPVRCQVVLRLRPRQFADLPAVGRSVGDPEPGAAHSGRSRGPVALAPADAVLHEPGFRGGPARRRCASGGVRLGTAHRVRR